MFKIGDKVVQKSNPPSSKFPFPFDDYKGPYPSCKKNKVYEVIGVMYCSCCGSQFLDLGLKPPPGKHYHCLECGGTAVLTIHTWWLRGLDFEKVVYNNITAEIVEKLSLIEEKSDLSVKELSPKPETVSQ